MILAMGSASVPIVTKLIAFAEWSVERRKENRETRCTECDELRERILYLARIDITDNEYREG